MSPSFGVALLVVLSTLPGYVHAATATTADTVARGPFAALSPADKDVARSLYKAQTGSEILTLDEIAQLRRQGRGWEAVFKEMKSRRVISATSLSQVLRPAGRQPVAVVIAEGTTLQRTERLLFDDAGVVGRRAPVQARFRGISVAAVDYGRLLSDIQRLRDLPDGSRVLFEGSIDGRGFSVEVHRQAKLLDIRTEGLGVGSLDEAQRFAESFAPDTLSRLRVRGTIDGHRVEVRRLNPGAPDAPSGPPTTTPGDEGSPRVLGPSAGTSNRGAAWGAAPNQTPTRVSSSPSVKAVMIKLASDPAGGVGIGGFSRNHWITSVKRMLSPFGVDGSSTGDNSLRLYDPESNTWTYVWPAGHANGGVQKRDNHGSFYVPALDEFWVWGGSYLESYPGLTGGRQPYRSGRFSFRMNKWIAVGHSDTDAFVGVVKGGPVEFSIDAATAWSAELDVGVVFGGYRVGNPTDLMYLVEPNPSGPERYRWTQYTGPRPPARYMVHNAMVAAGRDFYLFGGGASERQAVKDFWKFDGVARMWTRLPDPPVTSGAPAVTYDSDRRLVVAWANDRLLAYAIDSNQWLDVTPPGLPCAYNHMAVYAPTAQMHIYQGGNRCSDGLPALRVLGIRLGDAAVSEAAATASASSSSVRQSGSPARSTSEPTRRFSTSTPPQGAPSQTPSTPPAPVSTSGQIVLPIKTWVKRPLPSPPDGPCTPPYGCKHVRPAVNLQNGRIYFFAGDYEHRNYPGTFSYSISQDHWHVEYPACGPQGEISPMFPDQNPWAYDSKRNLFYWTGGFYWDKPEEPCVGGSTRKGPPLTFDPATGRWSVSPFAAQPTGGSPSTQFSVYDPVTDSVIHLGLYRGDNSAIILRLATNTWEAVNLSFSESGGRLDHGDWTEDNQPAIDVKGRAVYLVDRGPNNAKPRLLRYNIDRRTLTDLGPTPQQTGLGIPLLAWDSVNNVLYWLTAREYQGSVLWAYHPDPAGGANGRWERLDMLTADGVIARGNLLVFDPLQNALLLMGGVNWNNEPDPSFLKYLFLYRYGDGSR